MIRTSKAIQKMAVTVLLLTLIGCAEMSAIQPVSSSKSRFEGAAYGGESVTINSVNSGGEQYRLFEQGATGYVSLQSVRDDVEQRATQFCDRKGQVMNPLRETTSKPPHILGNFPRAELVFECTGKAAVAASPPPDDPKFTRLTNLKKLLDNGVLTQAEFEREKAKVLEGP